MRRSRALACISMVVTLLAGSSIAAAAEYEAWIVANSHQLLDQVEAAPRLPLEISQIVPQWPAEDVQFGMVSSVAADEDGLVYVLHRNVEIDPVIVMSTDGSILRSWGHGQFVIPHSIRIDPEGDVWTVDAGNSHIYKYSPQGEVLLHIDVGGMPDISSRFKGAADIAFASDGHLFVADGYGNARVLEYDADGGLVAEWGSPGRGPGEFNLVHAIAIDADDIIYVGDRENGRIQRFDRDGNFLGLWDGIGRAISLFFDGDLIWAGVQRLDQPLPSVGWVTQLSRETGEILGIVAVPEAHSLTVTRDGEFFVGSMPNRVLWYRHLRRN